MYLFSFSTLPLNTYIQWKGAAPVALCLGLCSCVRKPYRKKSDGEISVKDIGFDFLISLRVKICDDKCFSLVYSYKEKVKEMVALSFAAPNFL